MPRRTYYCPFQPCHLRTVIVTAAVYRGLDSRLRPKANLSSCPSGTGQASAPIGRPTRLPLVDHRQGFLSLPRPAIGGNGGYVVQEYQPVVHRLRLTASA